MTLPTVHGHAVGSASRYIAAAPATLGAAEDVPRKKSFMSEVPVRTGEGVLNPGEYRSTTDPVLEVDSRASVIVLEATVITCGIRDGVKWPASGSPIKPLLPA